MRFVCYCFSARTAASGTDKNPQHCVRVPLPSCKGARSNFFYVGTRTMPDPEHRRRIVEEFAATPFAVLFTTEAWSHGNGVKGTSMVVQTELPRGGVEFWQRSGHGARSVGERALVVQTVGAKMIAMRALFSRVPLPGENSPLVETFRLCKLLATRGCLRQHVLSALGQSCATGHSHLALARSCRAEIAHAVLWPNMS